MNPARSLGPEIVSGDFVFWWIYVVGPFAGGLVAALFAYLLARPRRRRAGEGGREGIEDRTHGRLMLK